MPGIWEDYSFFMCCAAVFAMRRLVPTPSNAISSSASAPMGMILTVLPMGNDALLEIAFDGVGTKRLMANTAAQHMKKL